MLNFEFTAEQEEFRSVLRDFAKSELLPNYMEWDRKAVFPRHIWRKLAGLGVAGLRIPVEYGGSNADCVTTGIAAEEIGRGDFNIGTVIALNALISEMLTKHASEELKSVWLPQIARGEKIVGIALTEPGAGSDAAAIQTKAEKRDGYYILNGEKSGITMTTVADAFVMMAKTDPKLGARGVSAFLVESDLAGLERKGYEDLGNVPTGRGSLYFDQVKIPEENLIGAENKGFHQVMNGFDLSRLLLGLQALGAAKQTIGETIEHVKMRQSFGQPLAKYQGISFPIVERYTQVKLVISECYRGLWLRDEGKPHSTESAICKWLGPKIAHETIHQCLLFNGHYAYTKEMPIEQRMRDVMGMEIGDGTAEIQKIVIGRDLFGKEF